MDLRFALYWLDGKKEIIYGTSIANAFMNAGLGYGALKALDFYESGNSDQYYFDKENHNWIKR